MPVVVVILGVALDLVDCLVLLMVAYFAALMLVKPLTALLGAIPVIGSQIAKALNDGANAFMTWAQDNWKNAYAVIVAVVSAPVKALTDTLNLITDVAELLLSQAVAIIQTAAKLANQVALGLKNIAGDIGDIVARATALAATVAAITSKVVPGAIAALRSVVAAWVDELRKAIAQAIDTAHVELGHAIDGVNASIHNLDQALRHAISQAIDGVQSWVNDRLRPIEKDIGDLGQVVWALPAVASIVATIEAVKTIEVTIDECVVPTCEGLSPSFDILGALANGVMLAAVMELAGQAISDPEAAADTLGGIAGELHGMVGAALAPVGITL